MKRWIVSLAFASLPASTALAQDGDLDRKREELMAGIRASLQKARQGILRTFDQVFDEQLKRPSLEASLDEQIRKLEEQLAKAKEEQRRLEASLLEHRAAREDVEILKEIRRAPILESERSPLFDEGLTALRDKDFDASIRIFKKLYYTYGGARDAGRQVFAAISAYNAACAYSLQNDSAHALDWFEISLNKGFLRNGGPQRAFNHIRTDTDLDNIRNLPRFKELIARFGG